MRRTHIWNRLALTGTLLALAGTLAPVRAQDADDLKRGVARISLMNGDVNVRRGDSGDWVAGVINAPLLTGDRVATGPQSRAEVQFDASNILRLGANAEVNLAQLEYGRYQMELARGLATFRMLQPGDVNVEIDTPSVSVRPSRAGSFRILVNDAGETEVTARNGDLEVFTPRGSQWVRSGQTLMARGNSSDPEFQVVNAGGIDEWDRWCESRDRAITQSVSSRYVGPGVYGAEDLDNYGQWESVPEYGYVWRPTVAADWTPYYYGRWSWADWYGWTWVSSDPWGWAPYHYGRWFHHDRFGWCWYPGVMTSRHYWSPALVAFVGFGGGGGVGFGFGNVGWVPLAPYEVYRPWWGRNWYRSGGYYNHQVNITNVNITNSYRNARFNAVSSVASRDFSDGRFNRVSRFNGSQIREAGAIHGAMPFSPGSQNLRFTDRQANNVPRGNENARFFRAQTPSPAARVPFQQQVGRGAEGRVNQPAMQQQGGESPSSWRRFGQTPAGNNGQGRVDRGGFGGNGMAQQEQRQMSPRVEQQQQMQSQPRQENRGGWQRFGSTGNSGGSQPQAQPQQSQPRQETPRNFDRGGRTFGQPQAQPQQQPQQQQQRQQQAPPRQEYNREPRGYNYNGGGSRQESIRVAPPVVRERPSYSAPQSQPRQAPSYSAPRQSAPQGGGGGNPRNNGGGGRPSGGNGGGNRHGR